MIALNRIFIKEPYVYLFGLPIVCSFQLRKQFFKYYSQVVSMIEKLASPTIFLTTMV